MKKKNGNYVLTKREYMQITNLVQQYSILCAYVKQKLMGNQLLSTTEVANRYAVTRHTIYRLQRANLLVPVAKYRCYYFDATEAEAFFQKYWRKPLYLLTMLAIA